MFYVVIFFLNAAEKIDENANKVNQIMNDASSKVKKLMELAFDSLLNPKRIV